MQHTLVWHGRRIASRAVITIIGLFALATAAAANQPNQMITLTTNHGDITLELDAEKAPVTVKNFIDYVEAGFFDGLIFHRVIPGFMIQGGGFDPDMKQKDTRDQIENEADNGLKNDLGTIAMARTADPHSATAQFFINLTDNDFLNHTGKNSQGWGYTVFGKVTEGLDVVKTIGAVATGRSGHYSDVPLEAVIIEKAVLVSP